MYKKVVISIFLIVLFTLSSAMITHAAPTESYTRVDIPGGSETNISREMYYAHKDINASTLGLEENLEGLTDIFNDELGNIYILLGDSSRLIEMDNNYSNAKEIVITDDNGTVDYDGARGIYSDKENIYIADTSNARVLIADKHGKIKEILSSPNSDLIPSDFLFQPISVERDNEGYTYILSLGCYYGALMYSPEYEFMGFYGSNTVEASALDTLSYLWEKLTSTEEKKAASVKTLPYSFTDFCFDNEGFMVTITGAISTDTYSWATSTGQIKKISHNGDNILYKRQLSGDTVSSSSINFLETDRPTGTSPQDLVSVTVNNQGYIFALDTGNGVIYIYDNECNLMSAFGGGYNNGKQLGVFRSANAISLNGEDLLVADKEGYAVTIYKLTEYGKLMMDAQSLYLQGDYEEAKEIWNEVLSLNRSCQLAYRGLAMVYYNEGDYKAALDAAEIALDYSVYDMAWQEIVAEFIANNFVWMILCLIVMIALIIWFVTFIRKRKLKLINNQKLKLMLSVPFHPFDSFDNLKYKKLGSYKIAIGITVLFYIASVLNIIAVGFLYTNTLMRNYNSLFTLGSTVGLILLWSVCNWLVCSMFSGKGNFKEVYTSTCYVIVPWVAFQFIKIVLTHFLPLSTAGIITGIQTALLIYTFFLLSIAMMKIHEYDFFKFLLTGLVTIFFMILVVFIIFLCVILIMQFGQFIVSVYEEVIYR